MSLDLCNSYVLRIIMAARKKDSIHALSLRIGISYGWTYKWVQELIKKGVFKARGAKLFLQEKNLIYRKMINLVKTMLSKEIGFYYEAIHLFGISYCFTGIDAVFIWTKGGYNIGRYKEYYPVYVKAEKKDKKIFEKYCRRCGLSINKKQGIFYAVTYVEKVIADISTGTPVESKEETISFMEKNKYHFEPALEMMQEMYKTESAVKYKEVATNV